MSNETLTQERLIELQSLPLNRKIQISQARIIEWYQHWNGNVVVSFSGGKDSTALLHMVRSLYPDVKAVFSNTGLEYPEIQKHVLSVENVDIVTPSMRFDEVISTYGYPIIGKEVAEAIYYARRMKPSDAEEKEDGRINRKTGDLIHTSTARNRRTILMGKWEEGKTPARKREELSGGRSFDAEKSKVPQPIRKRRELEGSRDYGEKKKKSMFNKEKYLPLVYTPFMISHYCCFRMKKSPIKSYQHKNKVYPYLGTLAEESRARKQAWLRHVCNAFEGTSKSSQPLSFWTEQDVLAYIVKYDLPIASVYGDIVSVRDGDEYPAKDVCGNVCGNLRCTGCSRTGCVFCGFGLHHDKGETRFQRLAKTHPRQYEYSIGGGQWVDNPHYDPVAPEYDGDWKNWNPKKIWVPSKKGLGMGKVFDTVNEIYGKDFIRYE